MSDPESQRIEETLTACGPAARVYLRPDGILAGRAAADLLRAGGGLAIAGPLAAAACELLIRAGGGVRRCTAGVGDLAIWVQESRHAAAPGVGALLERIAAPRADVALGPRIMGVVNVTPDSFSDGGAFLDPADAIAQCESLLAGGAHIIDVGGESTRPGALPVSPEVELARVRPVLEALRDRRASLPGVELSIDTRHAAVMRFAVDTGADIINDVSALAGDPGSLAVAAATGARIVLMHMQGTPATMNDRPSYEDVALDVYDYLEARIDACIAGGIDRSRLIVDPGMGFGKRGGHNLELLRQLALFHGLGCPILLGVSRKGLGGGLSSLPPAERVPSSLAAATYALSLGVQYLRVHDVAATRQVVELWRRLSTD